MTTIKYVTGDATRPLGIGGKVIAHVCNDAGGWGREFVVAISRRWPEPEADYRSGRTRVGEHAAGRDCSRVFAVVHQSRRSFGTQRALPLRSQLCGRRYHA